MATATKTKGKYGTITSINGGFVYSDPRDNPNFNQSTGSAAFNPGPVSPTIDSSRLGNVSSYSIPSSTPTATTGNLSLTNNAATSGIASDAALTTPTVSPKDEAQGFLKDLIKKFSSQATDVNQINTDAGLAAKKQKAQTISTELDTLDKSFRDEVKTIKDNSVGGTASGVSGQIAKAQDRYENRRANVSLAYKVANEDYQGAEQIATDKIQALKDQNAQSLQAYNLLINSVNNDLTESEKLQVQNEYVLKQQKAKTFEDTYASALQAGTDNKAGSGFFNALDAAKESGDITKVMGVVSQYGYKTLDQQYKATQTASLVADTQKKIADNAPDAKNVLKTNTLDSANELLTMIEGGKGTSAVGKSNFLGSFGYSLIPGTDRANFVNIFNNVKSLLSLDNIKYLKGQGAISDSERQLLSQASSKLDRNQSEDEFKKTLKDIVTNLGGGKATGKYAPGTIVQYKGKTYKVGADGDSLEQQ